MKAWLKSLGYAILAGAFGAGVNHIQTTVPIDPVMLSGIVAAVTGVIGHWLPKPSATAPGFLGRMLGK